MMEREAMFKGINLEETMICRGRCGKKIDGNCNANPAWISPEINLTGKTNSNRGEMVDIS
ncbi:MULTISPECIES: hypothetical protein [unclassified Paenibacillus]|uniref:hypothetical protein n=1 Tax=unclassified Paenibacillus TaxID=185978 RepID=UPI00363788D1